MSVFGFGNKTRATTGTGHAPLSAGMYVQPTVCLYVGVGVMERIVTLHVPV